MPAALLLTLHWPVIHRAEETWTTRTLLAWLADAFTKKDLDSPRLLAELLVAHVLGVERLKLYLEPDRPATPLERQALRDLVTRALKHEPVQYLVGQAWFFGVPIRTDRRALIPRPSTQTIVEHVLQDVRARAPDSHAGAKGEGLLLADVGTGSGCIAIALLKNLPGARAVATDISDDALALARENAQRAGVHDRLDLLAGDLLDPLDRHPVARAVGSLDYLASNPPYIPDDEWDAVEPNVKDHEPRLALRGGADGLDIVRRLIGPDADAPRRLKPGGTILVEVATSRATQALALARAHPLLRDARVLDDSDALPRVIVARRA